MIWAVFTGIRGPVGKSSRKSYEGDFLLSSSEQMRGFCHSLRQKPSSLLVLSGWSSDSLTSRMTLSIHPSLVKVMQVLRSWKLWLKWLLSYVMTDFSDDFLRYIGWSSPGYEALYPRRCNSALRVLFHIHVCSRDSTVIFLNIAYNFRSFI
jgi:hypothetical protein